MVPTSQHQTLNISGYYQQYRNTGSQNAFAQQLERDRIMSTNKLSQNYSYGRPPSGGSM